jgi:predicted CXXCH cytochrome family protein
VSAGWLQAWPTAVLFGPALGWLLIASAGSAATLVDAAAWGPVDRRAAVAVGDQECRRCHDSQWRSWQASYHRTMTQPASAAAAPFGGETLEALGFVATMSRDGVGTPRVRIVDPTQEVLLDVAVELVVGSHRYQQYVARIDRGGGPGELWRLPVAWHLGEARWIHLNGAFLAPDGVDGDRDDYLRHLARYNDNCIFCHNTEPVPGLDSAGHWQSSVAQWGIACEACHGPASVHVERHRSPARRVWSPAGPDGSITHPGTLAPDRSNDVCGRCHGQRIGHDIGEILAHGDGFVPGESLADVSRPIFRDSAVAGVDGEFATRFWPDGTPRLSAHEFQGVLSSPCTSLSCGTCHDMHGPTPAMQLRRDWDPTQTCLSCHVAAQLGNGERHGGHGDALSCVDCHMPRTTYGLLGGMISHRISTPAPAELVGQHAMPDACTQCHVDRSRAWAAAQWRARRSRGRPGSCSISMAATRFSAPSRPTPWRGPGYRSTRRAGCHGWSTRWRTTTRRCAGSAGAAPRPWRRSCGTTRSVPSSTRTIPAVRSKFGWRAGNGCVTPSGPGRSPPSPSARSRWKPSAKPARSGSASRRGRRVGTVGQSTPSATRPASINAPGRPRSSWRAASSRRRGR